MKHTAWKAKETSPFMYPTSEPWSQTPKTDAQLHLPRRHPEFQSLLKLPS